MSRQVVEDIRGIYICSKETPAINITHTLCEKPISGNIAVTYVRRALTGGTETQNTKNFTYGTSESTTWLSYNGDRTITFKKPKNEKVMLKGVSITYNTDLSYGFKEDKSKTELRSEGSAVNTVLSAIKTQKLTKSISGEITIAVNDYWTVNFYLDHSIDRVLGICGFQLSELVSGSSFVCGGVAIANVALFHSTQVNSQNSTEIIQLEIANVTNRTISVNSVTLSYKYLDLE